ncbi:hypothetical protein NBRC116493_24480 [Aurantivibrio infirmus]
MKILSFHYKYLLLIVVGGVFITACLPFNPYERAAVVISNETNVELNYQLFLSGKWTAVEKIAAGDSSHVFQYDTDKGVFKFSSQLTGIRLQLAKCEVTIRAGELEDFLIRDQEGRYVWGLNVAQDNLEKLGCILEI